MRVVVRLLLERVEHPTRREEARGREETNAGCPLMRIRFQADADLNQAIVAAVLRHLPEVDFRTAPGAKLGGLHDLEMLAIAARGAASRSRRELGLKHGAKR